MDIAIEFGKRLAHWVAILEKVTRRVICTRSMSLKSDTKFTTTNLSIGLHNRSIPNVISAPLLS